MTEAATENLGEAEEKMKRLERYVALAKELENTIGFPFPGLEEQSYANLLEDDSMYPGCTTPIDEIVRMMTDQGIKVALGTHPESGNVFILPKLSDDIDMDSLFPRHLVITDDMAEPLAELIRVNRSIYKG